MEKTELFIFIIIGIIILVIFIAGTIMFIINYRNKKMQYEKEKIKMNETHTKELLSTQLEMQQQTMQYIGREIHDNVGQKLTLASLYTQQLAYENKAPHVNDKIENIGNIINESLTELRQLSKSLTDDSMAANTITVLLQQECERVDATKKCRVRFNSHQPALILPYQTKSIVVRIVQEFLQNSIKHADCNHIDVDLSSNNGQVQLYLKDDGKGFATNTVTGNGIGLSNMKKRTELIGGNFNLDSKPGNGTTLTISIPV